MKTTENKKDEVKVAVKQSECGAEHSDCPNAWKGTCERPAGHDGSHYCSRCHSYF